MAVSQQAAQQTQAVRAALKTLSSNPELSPDVKVLSDAIEDLNLWMDTVHKDCTNLTSWYNSLKQQVNEIERRIGGIERRIR
jgi:hypothetical protein